MFRTLCLSAAVTVLVSCGTPVTTNCASTCSGCCTAQGECLGGTNDLFACGANGAMCTQCNGGQSCQAGFCSSNTGTGGGSAGGTGGGSAGGTGGGSAGGTGGGSAGGMGGGSAGGTGGGSAGGTGGGSAGGTGGGSAGGTGTGGGSAGGTGGGSAGGTGGGSAGGTGGGSAGGTGGGSAGGTGGGSAGGTGGGSGGVSCGGGTCPAGYTCNVNNVCVGGAPTQLVFNEVSYAVSGSITINGAAPTRSASYCALSGNVNDIVGVVSFIENTKGYTATYNLTCANTVNGFDYNLLLAPGTYEVRIAPGQYTGSAGVNLLNLSYQVTTSQAVTAPITGLVLNEVGHAVSGSITVNGAAPTRSASYCALSGNVNDIVGVVSFIERTKGYTATYNLTCTTTASGFTWNFVLAPGTYEVRVAPGQYTGSAGVNLLNLSYQVTTSQAVTAPITGLVLNEVGHAVSGSITVNGAAPTRNAGYCALSGNVNDIVGVVSFIEKTKGYTATYNLTCTTTASGFTWSFVLAPGTYEVRVAPGQYTGSAGVNLLNLSYQVTTSQAVSGPITGLVLNEVGHAVSGSITVNGAAPTRSASYCALSGNVNDIVGVVSFIEKTKGYTATYNLTCTTTASGFTWSFVLAPGTYEVRVAPGQYTGSAGVNLLNLSYQVTTSQAVSGPITGLVLNEVGHAVSGSVTVDGAMPTRNAAYCALSGNVNDIVGVITFTEQSKGYTATYNLTCTTTASGFTYSLVLAPGTYEVRVAPGQYTGSAGVNLLNLSYQVSTSQVVAGQLSNLTLNEVGVPIAGSITVNGAPPTRNAGYCALSGNVNDIVGVITFTERTKGYTATYNLTCTTTASGFNFSLLVAPGTYEVRIAPGQYTGAAGVNLLNLSYQAVVALQI